LLDTPQKRGKNNQTPTLPNKAVAHGKTALESGLRCVVMSFQRVFRNIRPHTARRDCFAGEKTTTKTKDLRAQEHRRQERRGAGDLCDQPQLGKIKPRRGGGTINGRRKICLQIGDIEKGGGDKQ